MITLELSVAEAAALVHMVGPVYDDVNDGGSCCGVSATVETAVRARINAELGDAVIAAGGPEATTLQVERLGESVYTLGDAEEALFRRKASQKLFDLGAAMSDVSYTGLPKVRSAYARLGSQTKAKLSAELTTLLSSL